MTTATDWDGLLNTGISAYKRGDYAQAIANLQKLSRCPSSSLRTKAGMGLVRAYMAEHHWGKAKALCETIGRSSKPAVQKWATDTLIKIEARSQLETKNKIKKKTPTPSKAQSLSGFKPLASSSTQQKSTHTPAKSRPTTPPQSTKHIPAAQELPTQEPTTQAPAKKESAKEESENSKPTVSMFHYAYLNNEIRANETRAKEQEVARSETAIRPEKVEATDEEQRYGEQHYGEQHYEWRNAGRLSKGRSLGKIQHQQIWASQTLGAITLYALALCLVRSVLIQHNQGLRFIRDRLPGLIEQRLPLKYLFANTNELEWKVLSVLGIIAIAMPWLWDIGLRVTANRQSFSMPKLRQHSPEAAGLITKRCQGRQWPIPKLWQISTDVPLIFSYGWLPRNARMVFTEGLFAALSEEEIATLVAYEMSHWQTLYWPLLSLQGFLLLVCHHIYWQVALWGNRQSGPLRWLAGIVSNLSYCVFWIARLPGMWVNRVRTYYGDRSATQLTGNPNALARALTKLAFELAKSTQKQGYTPATVERFTLLLPTSMELTRSSLYGTVPLAEMFAWDTQHPLRNWMSILNEHPPLGDRLRLLMAYAKHWQLDPEISLAAAPTRQKVLTRHNWGTLIRQGMPFFGLLLGSSIGLSCLLIGGIGHWLEWPAIDWMYKDIGIFWFCPLMGLGLGTFLRINPFFPDLSLGMKPSQDIPQRLCNPTALPVDSTATKLSGTLIGRPGLANGLGQDLMIQTNDGLLRLHVFSTLDVAIGPLNSYFWLALGPFGNLISQHDHPSNIIGKSIQVLGWFRQGNRVWIDVDKIRLSSGKLIEGTHPTTSLLLAIASSGLALWLLGFKQIFQETWDKLS
ncbi:MAG: M48 family metalloprotease [Phormidesmis sp.]